MGRIFVQILLIFPYKSGENHENSEPRLKTTTYMWDDKFYYLAAESFTGFDHYSKGLRVELALALLSDFLKKFTFAIFGREPKGVRVAYRR